MHEVIAKGTAVVRRNRGWTQEQAAGAYRLHGLTTWRTSTVGSLEAGLRRPRLDEVLLMCAALEVTLADLIRAADEDGGQEVELGDGAILSTRVILGYLHEGFEEIGELSVDDPRATRWFPGDDRISKEIARSRAERERLMPVLAPIIAWSKEHGGELAQGDYSAAVGTPSDADRHAARRLGTETAVVRLAARALWHQDFDQERDERVGDVDRLEPRSRQAHRGLVTRALLAELEQLLHEADGTQGTGTGDG